MQLSHWRPPHAGSQFQSPRQANYKTAHAHLRSVVCAPVAQTARCRLCANTNKHPHRKLQVTAAVQAEASNPGPSSSNPPKTLKAEAAASNAEVYDKLIAVFSSRSSSEWRKLIAFSKQWSKLADGVLQRIEERATSADSDEKRAEFRKLGRKLKQVHEELQQYGALVKKFRSCDESTWEGIVAQNRPVMGAQFFAYLENLAKAAVGNENEQQELVVLLTRTAALVEALDQVEADQEAMKLAAQKFQHILQVESLEEADEKIDELASTGQLDPALLLMMAKAYQGTKDTQITREEVKDIMAHLYFKAKESFAQQQPPEVRILKHLLSLDDPKERMMALGEAFTPGADISTDQLDYLSSTPENLMKAISAVLTMFETQRGKTTMLGEAAAFMNPEVIERLKDIQGVIRKQYM